MRNFGENFRIDSHMLLESPQAAKLAVFCEDIAHGLPNKLFAVLDGNEDSGPRAGFVERVEGSLRTYARGMGLRQGPINIF